MSSIPQGIPEDLREALVLLRSGQREPAQHLLTRIVETHPDVAEAHWLLATLHFENRELEESRGSLLACLELDPNRASAYALLGEVLIRTGNPEDAERSLRHALSLQANHVPAAAGLAYLLLFQGRPAEAVDLITSFQKQGFTTPALLMLLGRALLALGRASEAVDAFRQMLRLAPGNVEGEVGLAAALTEAGQATEAESALRKSMAQGHRIPESHFVMARALMAQLRYDEAVGELRTAVRARPDYVAAQLNLCELLWMQTGDVEAASAEMDAALRANPDLTALRNAKAKMIEVAQGPEDAIAELEEGLAHSGDNFELNLTISQIALKSDAPRALHYANRALRLAPDNAAALAAYCGGLLGTGRAKEAAEIAQRLHRRNRNDSHALALLATAWRILEDPRYAALYDYRLVIPQLIHVPDGWSNLDAYLADLSAGLRHLHAFQMHPIGQSLRLGSQADLDFERLQNPAVKAFPQAIGEPIRRCMQIIGTGDDALRSRNTGRYKLAGAWSVRLRPHGRHVNHIHPDGWLSSACYIDLPPLEDDGDHGAWIQFGEPGIITIPKLCAEHYLKPQPGLLVLFPSYMWHGTVPFDGPPSSTRLTIAFDVVPA